MLNKCRAWISSHLLMLTSTKQPPPLSCPGHRLCLLSLSRAAKLCCCCGRNTAAPLQPGAGVGQEVMTLQSSRGVPAQAHPSTARFSISGPPQTSCFSKPLLLQWETRDCLYLNLTHIPPIYCSGGFNLK